MFALLGAMMPPCWDYIGLYWDQVGLCWPMLEPFWAMLVPLGAPSWLRDLILTWFWPPEGPPGACAPKVGGGLLFEKSPSPPCWLMDVYFQSCWLVLGPISGLRTPDLAGDWLLEPTSQARYANIAPTCHPIASTSAVPSQSRAPCGKPAPSQSKSLSSQSLSGRSRGAMLAPVGAMLGLCRPRSGDHSDPPSGLPNATGLFCKKCRFA